MNRKILLNMIKVILFLFFLSTCWMIYSTSKNMREGFAPTKCSELGDCTACAGVTTATPGDGLCAWDSKTGVCRKPAAGDDETYVSTSNQCSARTTGFAAGYKGDKPPSNSIWINPNFGCPVCPTLHSVTGGSQITTQK
jgi:hypothetical protein